MLATEGAGMDKIDDPTVGEIVYAKSKDEKASVKAIHPPTITVRFLTSKL
jgi:hypothetical protein